MTRLHKTIITTGEKYTDIDGLACGVAYKNLCDLLNKPAVLFLPGPLNESVSKTVRSWDLHYETVLNEKDAELSFVVLDISDPAYIAKAVVEERVIELYDHRYGFENYWREKLGDCAHIEMVGSCATLVWEEFKKSKVDIKISKVSANLLYTAIVSNTLNFNANVTTERDKTAANEVLKYTDLPVNWIEVYYSEIESAMFINPLETLKNDTKEFEINGARYKIGQLELWDSQKFIDQNKDALQKTLDKSSNFESFITSPSISEGINYLICENETLQKKLSQALDATFKGPLGTTKRLWLRKEIMKELYKK